MSVAVVSALVASPFVAQQDSLDLAAALRLVRERRPVLAAADAQLEAARAGVEAASSARLPRVSAEGLYLRYEDPPSVTLGPLGSYAPFGESGYLAGARATQTLHSSGRITTTIRSARATARAAALARARAEVDLTAAARRSGRSSASSCATRS